MSLTKPKTRLSLASLTIGGLIGVTLVDFGAVAIGIKDVATLPAEVQTFSLVTGSAFIGWMLRKSLNKNKKNRGVL